MKTISNALQQFLLNNTAFSRAYLITITLPNGQVLHVSDGTNADFTVGANINSGALIGAWADSSGEVIDIPFQVGNSWSGIAPIGATRLLLGVEDVGQWNDNIGSWTMLITPPGSNITVLGTAQPWVFSAANGSKINSLFFFDTSLGAGTAPTSVNVTTGTAYTITYVSGTVSRKLGFFGFFDANGSPTISNIDGVIGGFGWPAYWFARGYTTPARFYATQFGVWERGPFTNEATWNLSAKPMQLTAFVPETVMFPGTTTPMMQVINQGAFNGAQVNVQTVYWATNTSAEVGFSTMGTMQLMNGQIGSVKPAGRSKVIFEVFDMIYLLNKPVPPLNIQSACRHSLFDVGCTLLASNFTSTNIALAANSTTINLNLNVPSRQNSHFYNKGDLINAGNIIYMNTTSGSSAGGAPTFSTTRGTITNDAGAHWLSMNQAYPLGYVIFTGGDNAGLKASVKSQQVTGGVIQLSLLKPLNFKATTGDTLELVPGCDKTIPTCTNVYNNLIHFGGQPFVPNPETAQ